VTEVALADLVTQALGLCHEQITNAGAEVTVAPDLPTLRVDGERFVQVWQNLIDNAVKYRRADAAPRIDIGWSPGKTEILLTVRDNGGGIAEPDRERIFGLFQRLDTATDGSGVGLSIVKRVVEAHGGRVWVTSTPGEGSTFFIGLPAAAIASAAAPRR
jgi:signal transduction histidine kinase